VDDIAAILRETGLDPEHLKLEITEGAMMQDTNAAIETMLRIKELGVRLALDDFGTGYASLSNIRRFPFDTVKIDRSFVGGPDDELEDKEIVGALLDLAKKLNLAVTAEGIETNLQLDQLRELGCEMGQGYFFARPFCGRALTSFMSGVRSSRTRKPAPGPDANLLDGTEERQPAGTR
jgi:Amt family ammonium transporter